MESIDLDQVYMAIHTLYSNNVDSISHQEKQAASSWLNDMQKSVQAWNIADQLLHRKVDLYSCYFGAHTLRTKIQCSFNELPVDTHMPLRDSLLQHVAAISTETDQIIVTQLCLAVTHLVLQSSAWADPVGQLLNTFCGNPRHWWPMLEILTLLPEEVHSRKLQLGDNRRNQIITHLESSALPVLTFLKQCLTTCIAGNSQTSGFSPELCCISIVKCFGSWITINPECFCSDRSNEVLTFTVLQLKEGKCGYKMHTAASDCLCAVIEVVSDMGVSSNNNATELQSFQFTLHTSIMNFEEDYHYAVAEEDQEKVTNYCRIFSEYGESMIPHMLRCWRDPHYSIRAIELILMCDGHHDYEIAEMTFGFWYRLGEDLYHAHDESLNQTFRSYTQRLIIALYKHCQIEPDHEGPLSPNDDFSEFRRKASELLEDIIFIVPEITVFQELGNLLMNESSWEGREAALHFLYTVGKSIDQNNNAVIQPIVQTVLHWSEWRHVCLRLAAVRFLGGMAEWLNKHPQDNLEKTMNFLVECLPMADFSNVAAAALQNICQECAQHIADRYMDSLIHLVSQMDNYEVSNEAVVGLLRGVGHVLAILPRERLSQILRQICWAQLQALEQICTVTSTTYQKGSKNDPAFWVDRLAALFRNTIVDSKNGHGSEHPCQVAICEDVWPVLSRVCDRFQADVRVMERVCRCLRYAVRCVGQHSHPFLQPLVIQLVNIYGNHRHSCLLYLGSILVDEYGSEDQCIEGLINMLSAFMPPTFQILNEQNGLRNHPDTVDDFFRLCARYVQRCPLPFLKSDIIGTIIQYAIQATQLDHREANTSVMKFLYELVHSMKRQKDNPMFEEKKNLVRTIMNQHGATLIQALIYGMIYVLPMYTFQDICELLYEMKEVLHNEFSQWLENALKQLPNKTPSGTQAATLEQLEGFHKRMLSARGVKDLSRVIKEFCRLYR